MSRIDQQAYFKTLRKASTYYRQLLTLKTVFEELEHVDADRQVVAEIQQERERIRREGRKRLPWKPRPPQRSKH